MKEKVLKAPTNSLETFGKMVAICAGIIIFAQISSFMMEPIAAEERAMDKLKRDFPEKSKRTASNLLIPAEIKNQEHLIKNYLKVNFENFEGKRESGEFGVSLDRYYIFKVKSDENGRINLNLKWHAQRFEEQHFKEKENVLVFEKGQVPGAKKMGEEGNGGKGTPLLPFRLEMENLMQEHDLQMNSGVLSFKAQQSSENYLVGLMVTRIDSEGKRLDLNGGLSEDCDTVSEKNAPMSSGGFKINCSIVLSNPVLVKKEVPGVVEKVVYNGLVQPLSKIPLSLPLLTLFGLWAARKSGAIKVVNKTFYALGFSRKFSASSKIKVF